MSEPTSAHLDLDALADVASGETDATGHLAGCASCASRLGELTAAEQRVTAALGRLPVPVVPDDVAARLDAAIDAEPVLPAAPRSRTASMTALPPPAPGRRWLPAAAAAAVFLLSLGALGLAFQPGGGDTGTESSVAAGAGGTSLPSSQSGTDYADEAAVAQALPEVLGGTAAPAEVFSDGSGERSSGDAGATASDSELSADSDADAMTQQAPAAADELARLRTPEGLADCLTALLPPEEPDVQPLALDYAQYEGQPALAVLLPDPDPEKVAVFVVGADCTQADEDLLTFLRVDAP